MLTFAYYLLKVIICSGILYGYYLIALRNKIFHRWNRFYLLAAIGLTLAVPLIKINIWQSTEQPTAAIQLLQVVSTGDEIVFEYTKNNGSYHIDISNLSLIIYIVVSVFLLTFLIQTLVKISRLKKNNRQTIVDGVNFINTNAKGTPFSFFNNIFWNENIDIGTSTGKQIFKHEVAHIQEKHSYDKVFINIVLIFFWINPFFWLIRKELNMIHEFIADKKAVENNDTAAFAAMILQATYPEQQFNLTNNFFYSPLKRRLIMLAKTKKPKISYVSRLLVLPLAALILFVFACKMKTRSSATYDAGKKISVDQQKSDQNTIQDTAVENSNSKDAIKAFIQERISKITENNAIKYFLIRKLSELNENSLQKNIKADSIPQYYNGKKIKSAQGSEKLNKAVITYEDGSKDSISITEAEKIKLIPPPPLRIIRNETIINVDVNSKNIKSDSIPDKNNKVFTQVETEAQFAGGQEAWLKYIQPIIQKNVDLLIKDNNQGTCVVQFIVDEKGNVSDVKATTMQNTKLAEVSINAIKQSPMWKPAMQNGHVVTSYRKQPISFKIDNSVVRKHEPE